MSTNLKNQNEIIERIKNRVQILQRGESSGHDWWHTFRVYKNSLKIAKLEEESGKDINYFVLEISALLHDIADHKFGHSDQDRAVIISSILLENNVEESYFKKIIEIVNNISFSKGNIPESLEGKIVQDADRIDALGAIGIARTFAYGGVKGREMYIPNNSDGSDSIFHFYEKLLLLKDKMNTMGGKKIAIERDFFMQQFLKEFHKEWNVE